MNETRPSRRVGVCIAIAWAVLACGCTVRMPPPKSEPAEKPGAASATPPSPPSPSPAPVADEPSKPAQPARRRFEHPCIPFTRSDLAALKANLDREPWRSGFAALRADGHSSLDYRMLGPVDVVSRAPHQNLGPWRSDMTAVYNLARMWYFTANPAYAQKARDILVAWADQHKKFGGNESGLDLGDYAFRFAGGASILRGTWPGWSDADTARVQKYFRDVLWGPTMAGGHVLGPANKGSLYMASAIAIAAFCDDAERFDHVVELFRYNNSAGLPNTLATGQMGETGRDLGHGYGDLISRAFVAEMAWKQGIDLFSERDSRLLACGEYYARNTMLTNTPFVHFGTIDYNYYARSGDAGNGYPANRSALYILQGAYKVRRGFSTPWMDRKIERQPVDADNWMYCKPSDHSTAEPLPPAVFPHVATITTGLTAVALNDAVPSGSCSYAKGVWTIKGGGSDVWTHGVDQCEFACRSFTGDCAIVARVASVQGTEAGAKAGVMIRDGLGGDARRAWIGMTASNKVESYLHGWSENWGGSGWEKRSQNGPPFPYWVKIERRGGNVTTFTSLDGTSWAATSCTYYDGLSDTVYLGLFVVSRVPGTLNTSTFTHVAITGGDGMVTVQPFAPAALLASGSDRAVTLRWLPSFGATAYDVYRATEEQGAGVMLARDLPSDPTRYTDTDVQKGLTYRYRVVAKNAAGRSEGSSVGEATLEPSRVNIANGGVASDRSGHADGGEGPACAFDQNPGSKWLSDRNAWLQYDLGAGRDQSIRGYTLQSANDVPERDPRDWQLLGSADGTAWTLLDERKGQDFLERFQPLEYAVPAGASYRYYRLNVTANHGADGVQLSELALLHGDESGM